MKKSFSTILAVVLTIALLASSFAMLAVHAEEEPTTELLSIGTTDYEIYTDKKFSAYDSIVGTVSTLTPGDTYTTDGGNKKYSGPVVDFTNSAWSVTSNQGWATTSPTYIKADANYSQIAFYLTNPGFAFRSVAMYDGKLYVNPSHNWIVDEVYSISLNYTVKESGNIVLYDSIGTVKASNGVNTAPFWDWLASDPDQWASFSIYKNNTRLWPKGTQDNKFEAGGEAIEFPDLGTIKVEAGDVISIKVEGEGSRTGIYINPVVAYAKVAESEEENEPVETEDIVLGDKTYTIETKNKFNAYDTLQSTVSELNVSEYSKVNLSKSVWQVRTARWNGSYDADLFYGPAPYSSNPAFLIGNSATHWAISQNSVSVVFDPNEYLAVSPFVKDDDTASAIIDLDFKAPKTGKVVIYDLLGAVKAPAANNIAPYWAWLSGHINKVKVSVLLNGKEIWPNDTTVDNMITDVGDSVAIPDLGEIEVLKGDRLTLRIQETNQKNDSNPKKYPSRDVVYTDIEVAYVYDPNAVQGDQESDDPNKEIITVGNNNYTVLKDAMYDMYSGYSELIDGVQNKSEVKFKNNWKFAYRYTNDVDFGKNPWKGDLKYVAGIPYNRHDVKGPGDVTYRGIYPASDLTINTWHNCFFNSSVTLIPETETVYISPTCDSLKDNKIAEEKWGPVLKLTFKSNKSGKAILYDPTGVFDGDVGRSPFWANEGANATTKIEIYKNNKKIWPTDGDVIITNTNKRVAFPDLGEINVKIGDEISFVFSANAKTHTARTGVLCNPSIAFTEVTATGAVQTDANFGTEVMILVSVITVLGAVVIAMGVVSKKRGFNN